MDFISPVIDIISCLWGPTTQREHKVVNLRENVESLHHAMDELKSLRNDVKRRVDDAEQQLLKCRDHVKWWLERVAATEREVIQMIEEFQQMTRCFGNCRPNCWSGYKLGKMLEKKLKDVDELKTTGKDASFNVVAELPDPVEEQRSTSAVGMDLMLKKALSWLSKGEVGVIGIYGMGGVGKTTLLSNINNEFLNKRTHAFDVVIWVVVSKEVNVGKIQMDIGKRLGLSNDQTRAHDIRRALSGKKFMLLLDDIWKMLDLDMVGIPHPSQQNMSKVVFTTRRGDVCYHMNADKKVRVECLLEQEAWDLFHRNVGEEAMNSHRDIPALAMKVAKECKGLPLALITIGRAMSCKKTPQEWEHAISVLSRSKPPSEISGMDDDDDMLWRLKFSYDNLGSEQIKSCFLYCSLFPEDYSIKKEEVIDYWIGEGFLDGGDDDYIDGARNRGHNVIGILKVACLLESGNDEETEVKLHDVIRDLALWIASECGKKKKERYLVKAGVGLKRAPEVERWKEAERISLMNNDIKEVTGTPRCLNLLTLMLQRNFHFEKVHTEFFHFMPLLRVLDLSGSSRFYKLPAGVGNLAELRYLNPSKTQVRSLPEEIGNLVKLEHLGLNNTYELDRIPKGAISRLSELRVMNLYQSSYSEWEEGSEGLNMSELEGLERLTHLGISVEDVRAFEKLLGSDKLRNGTRYLDLRYCEGPTNFSFEGMRNLKRLDFLSCKMLEEMTIGEDGESVDDYPVSSLEHVSIDELHDLNRIRVGRGCFRSLRSIAIKNCEKLKKIHCLLQLESLETMKIANCRVLEEIISRAADDDEVGDKGLMQLKTIKFTNLPELTSICGYARDFPSLEVLQVINCPKLKKLPLSLHSAQNSLREIRGEKEWWDCLEWEDDSIKSCFLQFFKETHWYVG